MPRLFIKRFIVIALASVTILAGLLVGGVRLIDAMMPEYRQALASRIGQRIDAEVSIESIELRWDWNGPVLELADVRITHQHADTPAIELERLGLHFALARLVRGERLPDGLVVERPQVALTLGEDGRPRLAHWPSTDDDTPLDWAPIDNALDRLTEIEIDRGRIVLIDPRLPADARTIAPVDIRVAAVDDGHRLQASARGPDWFQGVQARLRWRGPLPHVDEADFDIALHDLDTLTVARLADRLDNEWAGRLTGGTLSARASGHWQGQTLAEAEGRVHLSAVEGSEADGPLVPGLSADIDAAAIPASRQTAPDSADLAIAVSGFDGDIAGLDQFELSGAVDIDSRRLDLEGRHLPVDLALRWARLAVPRLTRTELDAGIEHFTLSAGLDRPLEFAVDFNDLTVDDPALAVGPLTGRYVQDDDTRILTLDRGSGTLSAPGYMRGDLPIDDVRGELVFQRSEGRWRLDLRPLVVASRRAQFQARGHVARAASQAPVVAIEAQASAPDAARLLDLIPQTDDLPQAKLRDWLDTAISAGSIDRAQLEVQGSLDRFPFANPIGDERFRLTLAGRGIDLAYLPDWPALRNVRGELVLDGNELTIDVDSARMLDIDIDAARIDVADIRDAVLRITGRVDDEPAEKMIAFLSRSPLRERFQGVIDAIDVSGPADLGLDLRVPLGPGLGDIEVEGLVDAEGATLRQQRLPGPINDIQGRVRFSGDGLRGEGLRGDLLGVPLRVDITPAADRGQRIAARGRLELPADRAALTPYLPASWLDYAEGASDFLVAFAIARDGRLSPIEVTGDLEGMQIALPAPLTKPAAVAAPLAVTIGTGAQRIDIDYDDRLAVDVGLENGRPRRVRAMLNDDMRLAPVVDGIWIGGRTEQADGIGWFEVVRDQVMTDATTSGDAGRAAELSFHGGDLRIGRLDLGNRYFRDVRARAQPMQREPGWRIDFEGPNTQGQVTWNQPDGQPAMIAGRLARLALQTRQREPETVEDPDPVIWKYIDPEALPALDIYVQRVQVDDTMLGEVEVRAAARPDGWQLDRLGLNDGDIEGWITGRWTRQAALTEASLQTRFEGRGLASLLRTLGYTATVEAERTRAHAVLAIAPNPNGLDLRRLDGYMSLALDDGTFTAVEPGAGRVLGLLNLSVLPRRLRLDFRDVTERGLAFDSVRAAFEIDSGNAYADAIRVKTPSATIRMTGRIGLAARDYDQRVTITPNLGTGAAIAGTVLGGPIIGAAVLAIQELFSEPIGDVSSMRYTLKGSWDDPRVEQPATE